MTEKRGRVELLEMAFNDSGLIENSFGTKRPNRPNGIYPTEGVYVPEIYNDKIKVASSYLMPKQAIQFIANFPMVVLAAADSDSVALPQIGQRIPGSDRRRPILEAWNDERKTPEYKVEAINLYAFNARITEKGITFGDTSVLAIMDGAGRIAAGLDDYNRIITKGLPIEDHVWYKRNLVLQINLDLSANKTKYLMEFLLANLYRKKVATGTNLAVHNSLLEELEKSGEVDSTQWVSHEVELAQVWIARRLYEKDVRGSVLELFPWQYEGNASTNTDFIGKGKSSNIATTLKEMAKDMDKSGIKVADSPEVLDFGFRMFHRLSASGIADAHDAFLQPKYKSKYRMATSLATKLIVFLTYKIFPVTGKDERAFADLLDKIIKRHFTMYQGKDYINQSTKKMDIDKFWRESRSFVGAGYNGGRAAAGDLMKTINQAVKDVFAVEGIETKVFDSVRDEELEEAVA